MAAGPSQKARADAVRNRARIVEVATRAYATGGIDVPMATIARRTGVGVATLYRHFPTREALIREVFAGQYAVCGSLVDAALADPDPWRGFCTMVEKLGAMQATDRGFTAAILTAFPDAVDQDTERARFERALADVTRRAQAAGRLRPDFDPADLILLLVANNSVAAMSPANAAASSRRLVAYLLQSFRAEHAAPLPPPPALGLHHVIGHARRALTARSE